MKPVLDSINQLISVIAGRAIAQQTVHLKTKPSKRCSEAIRIASEVEMKQGLEDLNEMNDDRKYKQVQRKLESLSSIKRTYEFMNNPFYGVIDGCKPQPSWVEITLELK